jgi:glycosyltransferase involved in cell wall biosynthesis
MKSRFKVIKNKSSQDELKKVLHIMGALQHSGMERMFLSSAGKWEKYGYLPTILSQGSINPYASVLEGAGYGLLNTRSLRTFLGIYELARILQKMRPKIVHIHVEQMHGPISLIVRFVLPRSKIVLTIHNVFDFSGFSKKKRHLQNLMSFLAGAQLVSVSEDVAKNEWNNYRRASVVIENWISEVFFSQVAEPVERNDTLLEVGLLGNCSFIKNHEVVLHVVSQNKEMHVTHIGGQTNASSEEVALFKILEGRGQISLIGNTSKPEEYLLQLDVLVMPSLFEGFSLALAESLALGVPCAINNSPGLGWALVLPGVIVRRKNESWDEFLSQLIGDSVKELRLAAGTNRDLLVQRFSPNRGIQQYVEIYKK